jgi:hypothetical protein
MDLFIYRMLSIQILIASKQDSWYILYPVFRRLLFREIEITSCPARMRTPHR